MEYNGYGERVGRVVRSCGEPERPVRYFYDRPPIFKLKWTILPSSDLSIGKPLFDSSLVIARLFCRTSAFKYLQ